MGDSRHDGTPVGGAPQTNAGKDASYDPSVNPGDAFQSQLDHLSPARSHDAFSYGQPLNMGAMAHALPHSPPLQMTAHPQMLHSPVHGTPHLQQQGFAAGTMDPMAMARAHQFQQAQYMYPPFNTIPQNRQPMPYMHLPPQHNMTDMYNFGRSPMQMPPQSSDQRFAQPGALSTMSGAGGDFSQYARRISEPAPVPSFPRGPPRKPKQSGHALWVGNLPPAAQIGDLKDHFSRDATRDIESLFLISKSNCAFVNYRTEKACSDAMARFHDSRFQGVRLVCRLRRSTATSPAPHTPSPTATSLAPDTSTPAATKEETTSGTSESSPRKTSPAGSEQEVGGPAMMAATNPATSPIKDPAAAGGSRSTRRVPERYFIVKSLTVQDLESSIRTGIWATQNHNESLFNEAFKNADNVYLIFSANKSGEYFGYARMASLISGQPVNLNAGSQSVEASTAGTPQAIETPATSTAPKGRIIDDSARGTIFWEAVRSDTDEGEARQEEQGEEGLDMTPGSNWGRQFCIEWVSTTRLPFYRTRGLRNPWNSNREVKIARDGTELEPSIGRRLVQMFSMPARGAGPQHYSMPYQ